MKIYLSNVVGVEVKDDKILFKLTKKSEKELIKSLFVDYLKLTDDGIYSKRILRIFKQIKKEKLREILTDVIFSEDVDDIVADFSDENKFKVVEKFAGDLKEILKEKMIKTDLFNLRHSNLNHIEKFSNILGLEKDIEKRLVADRLLKLFYSSTEEKEFNELSQIADKYPDIMNCVIRNTDIGKFEDVKGSQLEYFIHREINKFSDLFSFYFKRVNDYDFWNLCKYIKKFAMIKNALTESQLKRIQNAILSIGEKSLKNIIKRRINKENHKHYIKDLISLLPDRLRDELVVYLI